MKFGKVLKNASEEMPHMNDLFLRYKELKKKLKAIPRGARGMQTESESINMRCLHCASTL